MTSTRVDEPEIAAIVWHDLECGSYTADLEPWAELAAATAAGSESSKVLELGCGTGRVSLFLAGRGHRVVGVDLDDALVAELGRRARAQNVPAGGLTADVREFGFSRRFDVVLAAMQFLQLFAGPAERSRVLRRARALLRPGGRFAAALLDLSGEPTDGDYSPPLPDMCERDGWVWSSQAVEVRIVDAGAAIALDRHRRAVSPAGEIAESESSVRLELVGPDELEQELSEAGLTPLERLPIAPTEDHVGSIVVIAERPRD